MTIYKTAGFYIGILSMFFITALAYSLSLLPFLSLIGPLAIAILISVIYRNVFQYPENLRSGFTSPPKSYYGLRLFSMVFV